MAVEQCGEWSSLRGLCVPSSVTDGLGPNGDRCGPRFLTASKVTPNITFFIKPRGCPVMPVRDIHRA